MSFRQESKNQKRGIQWLFSVLFAFCFSLSAQAEGLNRIIAIVDGEPVTLYELRTFREERGGGLPIFPIAISLM